MCIGYGAGVLNDLVKKDATTYAASSRYTGAAVRTRAHMHACTCKHMHTQVAARACLHRAPLADNLTARVEYEARNNYPKAIGLR
jgi:hypothetical protein